MSGRSLPGQVPGLLRCGSPVLRGYERGVVLRLVGATRAVVGYPGGQGYGERVRGEDVADLYLDLGDPDLGGCAHAAWWCHEQYGRHPQITSAEWAVINTACFGCVLTSAQIETLRSLVLRLAAPEETP